MSAKSAIKVLVPAGADASLFKWVAVLSRIEERAQGRRILRRRAAARGARVSPVAAGDGRGILVTLVLSAASLPRELGKAKGKAKFSHLFSKSREINVLSAARFFCFGARDIWFVVGVPVFLATQLAWGFTEVGGFLAAWVIGYGIIQSLTPLLLRRFTGGRAPQGRSAAVLAFLLAVVIGAVIVGCGPGTAPMSWSCSGSGVRRRVRDQLVGPLVPDPRVLRRRQGRDERRLLLHGERRRTPDRQPCCPASCTRRRGSSAAWRPRGGSRRRRAARGVPAEDEQGGDARRRRRRRGRLRPALVDDADIVIYVCRAPQRFQPRGCPAADPRVSRAR